MPDVSPSIEQWKALYAAALEFKQVAPWQWMWDSDVFGVQNPEGGETGYCCVMGGEGEHFALGVYLGRGGLDGYWKLRTRRTMPSLEVMLQQTCLMASFEDRKFVEKQDRQVMDALGLRFRGRNAWPVFRSYLAGYYPWFLTRQEALYLTLAFQQSLDVALRFAKDPRLLAPTTRKRYLVRVPKKTDSGLAWHDEWLPPPPPVIETEAVAAPLDVRRAAALVRSARTRTGVWEVDVMPTEEPVRDGDERPYYPSLILVVDRDSGFVFSAHIARPDRCATELPSHLLTAAEEYGALPEQVAVRRETVAKLLQPTMAALGISLVQSRLLRSLQSAQTSLFRFFKR